MSRAKSARISIPSEDVAANKRGKFGRSLSLVPVREGRRSSMGEYLGERPLSAACMTSR